MQKVLLVYIVSERGTIVPVSSVVEMENFPLTEKELRDYERQLRDAGGFESATIVNAIPLADEDEVK